MRLSARCACAALLLLLPLTALPASAAEPSPKEPARSAPAPLRTTSAPIPDQYIVTLKPDTPSTAAQITQQVGATALHEYQRVLHGFAAKLDAGQLAAVRRLPEVAAVEQDATVTATPLRAPRVPAASWGLDRIDQPYLPLNGQFNVNSTGAGASAYILDTGIDYGHAEFGGRAVPGFDAMRDGRNGQDCNGHGTHVAGTVGGANYGVARQARLVSVRVLGCDGSGSYAGVIAGFDWVAGNARQPAVLNGSLGGPRSDAVNRAATALSDRGVLPVVAAGNDATDACNVSPASAQRVLTVGATDHQDQEASFSNHGPCLDMYAPGTAIVSARLGGGSVALSGTSMASPHVAGVATLLKGRAPSATSAEVYNWIVDKSVKGILTVTRSSPNRLVQTDGL
ncbi:MULTISPECIES: S8 family peptidase [Streptomyces]|uniref:S8 family peptidase n=1 Tax=Streptomyces TaxID=1883 RepID=UPI001E5C5EF3|nr:MULTISPECIES: S8 family peptidase [Streptomyces]UFQ19138.1 S8 family peptidase [Streptomyces huasconensis]WCL88758.1 S8 family peptidase [Streptomyces sp. JCM 35825]